MRVSEFAFVNNVVITEGMRRTYKTNLFYLFRAKNDPEQLRYENQHSQNKNNESGEGTVVDNLHLLLVAL